MNRTGQKQIVIMEIRAGTGGNEAGLFAADLFRMYSKYADSQDWQALTFHSHPGEIGGFKEIVFQLEGEGAYEQMKNEGGVHRVQRIPATEKRGRIHTSTATVAVLAKPKFGEIRINPGDLRIDTFRSSGPGGQHMQKNETAIRITHLPTGIVTTCQSGRNQQQNKESALAVLEARLLEKKEKEEIGKLTSERRGQIKGAKRAEKSRTYNYPQNRITDHQLGKKWHNLDKIMEGDLGPIIKAFKKHHSKPK